MIITVLGIGEKISDVKKETNYFYILVQTPETRLYFSPATSCHICSPYFTMNEVCFWVSRVSSQFTKTHILNWNYKKDYLKHNSISIIFVNECSNFYFKNTGKHFATWERSESKMTTKAWSYSCTISIHRMA